MKINNTKPGLASVLICAAIMGQARELPAAKCKPQNPNIIFILTDDQRWDALGYAGNKIIKTPEMDKLEKEGVYFRNALVTTPVCSASQESILTGLYERTHKYTYQTGDIRSEYMEKSYPALLKKAGYYTGFFGKFGVNYAAANQLFDVFDDYDRNGRFTDHRGFFFKTIGKDTVHLTRYTGQQALDFLDGAQKGKPFCLSLSFGAPHAHDSAPLQYFWTKESEHLYRDKDMSGPELADDKYFFQQPTPVRDGFNYPRWTWRFDPPEKYQHSVKGYYQMIHNIDLEIAKIRKNLKVKSLDTNTVFILVDDNGYFLGEHQLAGRWLMYDHSIRVPLIIYNPRLKKPRDNDLMALNIDIPSAMFDLAGVEQPATWHGKSLMPLVSGQQQSLWRDTILIEQLWEFENISPSEGVRRAEWKYLRYENDKSWEELYNLANDSQESENHAGKPEYSKMLAALRNKCDQFTKKYADPLLGIPSGLTIEFIRDPRFTKIINPRPVFSWMVPAEAVIQMGYQVLVSSDKQRSDHNIGDVWDSGVVRSSQSVNVEYGGKPLLPGKTCFWKVRIFDRDNRLTEYSAPQMFRTGVSEDGNITTPNWFIVERIEPSVFKKIENDSFFIDFGKAAFGTLELRLIVSKPGAIVVHLGEKLLDGRIDRNPGGHIRYQQVRLEVTPEKQLYRIELPPDQRNTNEMAVALPDSFPVIMPFRAVEIEPISGLTSAGLDLKASDVIQLAYFNYFDYNTSSFTSSDTILNQVWELCKYSQKATTFSGYYVDGDRERIPYEADAYLNQLSHYSVDNEYTIARRTIEYFMEKPTWPTEWQLHVALMFWQDYMYTGNTTLIEKYYEPLKHKTLMELEYDEGLISTHSPKLTGEFMAKLGFADTTQRIRDIVDWPQKGGFGGVMGEDDGFVFRPVNAVINALYYQNMVIMAEFARLLGKTEEMLDFNYRAVRVKKSFNEKLYNHEKGYYTDGIGTDHGSVHANMFPMAFGMVPEEYRRSVMDHIKSRGMACSVYGAQYLMEAVYNAGDADYGLELMTATHDRSWYNMIKVGATITMEAWDMKYKPNSDWNHSWGAAPANIIPRQMWGIQPKTPGFEVVTIRPQMGSLKQSSIMVPTIRGYIKGEYNRVSDRFSKFSFELPANMVGEFFGNFSAEDVVTLNGDPVNLSFGSVRLKPGVNHIEIRINSF